MSHTLSQSHWNIYVLQNRLVYVIKRLKALFLDPYFQFCKYSHVSKLFVYLYLLLLLLFLWDPHRERLPYARCVKLNLCAFDIFLSNRRYLKKICFALVPRLAAYFSSDVFPLNLISNNSYSEHILTICFGYNTEQYFPIALKMFRTDWLVLRVTHQHFEIECSKIPFLRGRGTSIINEIKRIE